ncbi:hypothetical protein [Stenotrophomonas daejeonensis]|uniref:hypothetical protein n=1 Tax=Stenotrophomonas daejeonensis TaxID=659018 RepID=UPI00128EECF5|nr:hypothetical protein [Stenotrophomonas daejeonensis]
MKKYFSALIFIFLYIAGILCAWGAGIKGWGVVFAFLWFYVVSKIVSFLGGRLGWTEKSDK